MTNYLETLSNAMKEPQYLLIILIGLYLVSATIDMLIGSFIAYKNNKYSSRVSQLGIVRKLVTLAVMVMIVPFALIMPFEVGVYSLSILYIGVVFSELYSVLGHVGIVKDGEKGKDLVGNLFSNILDSVVKSKKDK